jgi:hypothetical protein
MSGFGFVHNNQDRGLVVFAAAFHANLQREILRLELLAA